MTTKRTAKGRGKPTPERCATHLNVAPAGYIDHLLWIEDRAKGGMPQRRCPTCHLWFFRDEYGPGWSQSLPEMSTEVELRRAKGGEVGR